MVTIDDLRRRHGETFAGHMNRVRAAGIFLAWPAVLDGQVPRPFKIGIDVDFVARLDRSRCAPVTLRWLIADLVVSTLYLHGLARVGSQRHDVDGNPAGPVSARHRAHAKASLDERAQRRARRGAEQARRERLHPANAGKPVLRLALRS